MPIEMPRGLPFSVDTWTPRSERKRHHFLTHAHGDHLSGLASRSSFPVYATALTKSLVRRHFPQVEERVLVEIEVGESVVVKDPDGDFTVTAFDANHCPGAVMFLFEGEFGNILHTGDCRLSHDCMQNLPLKYITKKGSDNLCHLDYLFLDCTFGRCFLKIPSKQSAIEQVINCIWKHPNAPVVCLACDMLGQEEILVEVSKTFGSKIYVDKTNNSECFHALLLIAPEILSEDTSCRFQVIEGFPRLNERASQKLAEARANLQPAPLFIRPSSQWFANNDEINRGEKSELTEAVKDEFGVWHVCYSMHSSRDELEWALQLLQPKWVISTTPPCRAMELNYVKKHCYKTRITTDDPLWKLLRGDSGKSASFSSSTALEAGNVTVTSAIKASAVSVASNIELQMEEASADQFELNLGLSPQPSTSITLFGRARMGIPDTDLLQEKKFEPSYDWNETEAVSLEENSSTGIVDLCSEKVVEDVHGNFIPSLIHKEMEPILGKLAEDCIEKEMPGAGSARTQTICSATSNAENVKVVDLERDSSCIGSSKDLNVCLKKLYRSMNVPVPRPLPSLVELMNSTKRVKVGSESSSSKFNYCYNSAHYLS